ncbi:Zinc metalloprotease [Olavius algarvensis associated proteobacterium Delta 3]|nr:Zinc metalloprotease [Olavius algarvensis associated proteobacterium Delta 3]
MKPTNRREFLHAAARWALAAGSLSATSTFLYGCEHMGAVADLGTALGTGAGAINEEQAESIRKSAHAVARTFKDITPEQEYYIGRAVGAVILDKYPPYNNERANRYINLIGQTLARASDRPETFGGYHFLIQDSNDINALSAPGGFIFITRGMLRCCPTEDATAAVIAHEIGHVQAQHGLQAIKKSRITEALTIIGMEGAKHLGGKELATLTRTFEGSITDITRTLINNGYSREFEREADGTAITLLHRVGYDPNALIEMLNAMDRQLVPGRPDFASTHPAPENRVADIRNTTERYKAASTPAIRQKRFEEALGSV